MPLIDLTHTFEPVMPVYPGDPPATLTQRCLVGPDECTDFTLHAGMHVGTHLDGPLHMIEGGPPLCDIPVDRFTGRGRLIDARGRDQIDADLLADIDIGRGDMLLVMTGFSDHFGEPMYYETYPEITPAFAERAVTFGVHLVGMDTPSPDRSPFRTHKILLGAGVLLVENLTNLAALIGRPHCTVYALPAKLRADSAPVRVVVAAE